MKKEFACVTCNFVAVFVSGTPKKGHNNLFYLVGDMSCLIHSVRCPSTSITDSYILLEAKE
jgi:hypothetical protein